VLLDLRVLRLGLLKDGDVGVGVFLEVEELLVFQPSFVLISSPCEAYARPSWRCVRALIGVDSTVFRRREQARNLPAIFPTRVATTEKLTSAFGLVDGTRHKTDKS
jgi:hypothetical protein